MDSPFLIDGKASFRLQGRSFLSKSDSVTESLENDICRDCQIKYASGMVTILWSIFYFGLICLRRVHDLRDTIKIQGHIYVDIKTPCLHGNNSEVGAKTFNLKA